MRSGDVIVVIQLWASCVYIEEVKKSALAAYSFTLVKASPKESQNSKLKTQNSELKTQSATDFDHSESLKNRSQSNQFSIKWRRIHGNLSGCPSKIEKSGTTNRAPSNRHPRFVKRRGVISGGLCCLVCWGRLSSSAF
jgi:hypothetical protein